MAAPPQEQGLQPSWVEEVKLSVRLSLGGRFAMPPRLAKCPTPTAGMTWCPSTGALPHRAPPLLGPLLGASARATPQGIDTINHTVGVGVRPEMPFVSVLLLFGRKMRIQKKFLMNATVVSLRNSISLSNL
jgi:hypothetical protein